MKKLSLRLLVAIAPGNDDRKKAIKYVLLAFFFCCLSYTGYADVVITPATGGGAICSNLAVGGSLAGFTTLGTITISEGTVSDFAGPGTDVIVLNAPAGWQFGGTPTFFWTSGANVTNVTGVLTGSTFTITITSNGNTAGDQITINSLGVQATSAGAAAGYIYASSVTGVAGVTVGTSNFGNLSLTPLVTPSVSIAASPGSFICSGTNAVFTATPTGGGSSPLYQWFLNGISVVTSSSPFYSNSTLSSGNTIVCKMTGNASCAIAGVVNSNTITMVVTPAPSGITGSTNVCPSSTTALSDPTPSGAWSSANTGIASVNSGGVVTGVVAGGVLISYTVGSCSATTSVTVSSIPAAPVLTPSVAAVCNNGNVTIIASGLATPPTILSNNFNSGIAPWTVDTTGSVGTNGQSVWLQYPDGFSNSLGIYHSSDNSGFVMSNADAAHGGSVTSAQLISPVFSLVGYASATLTFQHAYQAYFQDYNVEVDVSTDGGGSWSVLQNYIGTNIGNTGSFVSATLPLTAYLGMPNLSIRFYYYSGWGYYWAVDNISITGTSSGIAPSWSPVSYLFTDAACTTPYTTGTLLNTVYMHPTSVTTATSIKYTATASNFGCTAAGTNTITVEPAPSAFTGNTNVCMGLTSALSNAVGGGAWSSDNTASATVNSATGVVSGVALGSANITYTLPGGCYTTTMVTVYPLPSAITGPANVCIGSNISLSAAPAGGAWTSGSSLVANVASGTGTVTGSSAGGAVITYSLGAGCISTASVTVNQVPFAIAGATSVCTGAVISLSDGVGGGTWSSSNTSFATIVSGTGVLSGQSAGTTTITYTLPGNCFVVLPVTVYPLPAAITGTTNVCKGLTTTLSNTVAGGVWSSGSTTIASVSPGTNIINGVAAGTAVITYTIGSSCIATTSVIVNPLPAAISGTGPVCAGLSVVLSDVTAGGNWSSSSTTTATVNNGVVTGNAGGAVTITYTLGTGCIATQSVLVNPLPATITGNNTVCIGLTTNLSDISSGGMWSSNSSSIATVVPTSGHVSGVSSGVATITYTLATGCLLTQSVIVNSLPSAIIGTASVCVGLTTTLSNTVSGGSWSSGNASAAVNVSTGVVTGMNAGIGAITYTLGTSCIATTSLLVNPLSPITGIANVCVGLTTMLSDATGGGTWSSNNTSFATIVTGSGLVNGISAGTTTIDYILPTGCTATTSVVVNPIPAAISGNPGVCITSTITLSDGGAGIWSSSNSATAAIGVSNGNVVGLALGTVTITYSLSAGCIATTSLTVNPLPGAISGSSTVCVASVISLTDGTTGGTWSSSNTSFATINSGGFVTGVAAGPVVITYTLPTGCTSVKNITVNPLPSGITGTTNVCAGLTTTLSDITSSGTWSSSNTSFATVNPASGVVTGIAAGTTVVAYGIGTGCSITTSVVVNPLPIAISGMPNVCMGLITTLSDVTSGGTWSSGSTGIATINISGLATVTPVSPGTTLITYTLGTGCLTTRTVTVNPLPGAISGNNPVCVGLSTALSDGGGGTWSSNSSGIATVIATTGIATGASSGTTTITYTLSTGCIATASLLVYPLPAAITGVTSICDGFVTSLSDVTASGTWSSSNTSVATIVLSGLGVVTSVSPGTTAITYTLGTGCIATRTVTVNPLPNTISGNTTVCVGLTTALSDAGSGTWSSSNTSAATIITATGVVTGVGAGPATITYTLSTGCIATTTILVNPLPSSILGAATICYSLSATLSDVTSGGTWSSNNTLAANIDATTGFVNTVAPGVTTITYTLGTGCITTKTLTVNPLPSIITGQADLCISSTATMSDVTASGTWSSSSSAIAAIGALNGTVTGVAVGTVVITYKLNTGCIAVKSVTVNAQPPAITGVTGICLGGTTSLSDASVGGTWSTTNTNTAIVNIATGAIFGAATGTALITYTVDTGCSVTTSLIVNSLPSSISGGNNICVGQTTPLSDITGGGTWSSSNTSFAIVGTSTGIVTGIASGTATIDYILSTGCSANKNITINASPAGITGSTGICLGSITTFSDAVAGGTWTSSNTTVAIVVDGNSGIFAGGSPGVSTIIYTLTGSCAVTASVTVSTLPGGITGTNTLCSGLTTSLTDATTGGVWSSSNTAVATVSNTGVVYGISGGTTVVDYTLSTGCGANKTVTVYPSPSAITGASTICIGSATELSNSVAGGLWTSTNTSVATIDPSSGTVAGFSAGASVVSYSISGFCSVGVPITVSPSPGSIIGNPITCIGLTTTLSDAVAGGTWSSSNTSVATVIPGTGVVKGVTAGSTIITYGIAGGCLETVSVTVDPPPSAISGATTICLGSGTILSNSVAGGVWSSSNTAIATIDPATGTVASILTGSSIISYSLVGTCMISASLTVNPSPAGIAGNLVTCVGLTTILSDAVTGGSWSSNNTAIATVTSGTGIVRGVGQGTAIITYKLSGGCFVTTSVTVYPIPSAITGNPNVCFGSTTTLSDAVGGGTWSSSNASFVFIGSATGQVVGLSPGGATVSYSIVSGCVATVSVTVNNLPSGIFGTTTVCIGATTHLSDGVAGGTWSSSNSAVATVVPGTGVVTGGSSGTSNIFYSLPSGCTANRNITVSPQPTAISGITSICLGSASALSDGTTGGTWTSSSSSVATVDPSTGLVSGIIAGTSTITYSFGAGCSATTSVSVVGAPPAITGTTTFCIGLTIALSDVTSGGVWSSSNTSAATVLPSSGHVTGFAPGVTVITYSIGSGCVAATTVTVNPLPSVISGITNTCIGSTTTLSDATSGGTWSSNNTTVATINTNTGFVIGFSSGTANITYSLGAGCTVTTSVTVGSLPSSISGSTIVCIGFATTLSDATIGGTWSSNNTSVAIIDPGTGMVSGVAAGSTNIVYTLPSGCTANRNITVSSQPSAISGNTSICPGAVTVLSDMVAGGTWSSGSTSIATAVAGTGAITGVATGVANITYAITTGCVVTASVSVIALPTAILGNTSVCLGSTTALSDASGSGAWSSNNTSVATINPVTGAVTGFAIGNTIISYTAGTGCSITTTVIVQPLPSAITGAANVCVSSSAILSDVGGGTWGSNNTLVATIGLSSGVLSGVSSGPVTITYTLGTGCITTTSVNIIPLPLAITGATNICSGTATTLSNAATGGTWSSSNTGVASINVNTGVVTGGTTGPAIIFYKLGSGCSTSTSVTVNPLPAAITGIRAFCEGSATTLSDAGGGTWSSGSSAIAAIGSSTGIVTGNTAGTAMITYMLGTGCIAVTTVTVNSLPAVVGGITTVCAGLTTMLSDAVTGGSWSSGSSTIATVIAASGLVSGIAQGTAVMTYQLTTGCLVTTTVTVDPLPSGITGTAAVCAGLSTLLSDTGGGTWSSSNSGIASVDNTTGIVSGISAGTARITYTLGTGCITTRSVTVNPLPSAISGNTGICVGTLTSLSDGGGGVWNSGVSSVATITAGGVVSGVSPGTAPVTYTLGTGCIATTTMTVNALPLAITGAAAVCAGSAIALSDGGGGAWSSSNTSFATVNPSSGIVSGIAAGVTRITYSLGTGCITTATVTVNSLPSSISGATNVCLGAAITLSDAGGGTWSSNNTNIAAIGTGTGTVTGAGTGAAIITYKLSTGCFVTTTVTVNPVPAAITGITTVCSGSSTILSDAVIGGTWSSTPGSSGIATITSSTGVVSGVAAGTANITYELAGSCITVTTITVQSTPLPISGSAFVCYGSTTGLNDSPTGGIWSTTNSSVAIVSAAGVITAVNPGVATISYSLGFGCTVSLLETVYPVYPITGTTIVCAGQTTDLSDFLTGGTWSSSNNSVAVVNTSGTVTGISGGTATINYTSLLGCTTTIPVTINPSAPIIGANHVCVGFTTTMNNAVTGGTWSSDNTAIATISSSGVVTGVAPGPVTINYLLASGCAVTATMTVNIIPAAITGNTNVCLNNTTYLSDVTTGGIWGNSASSGILAISPSNGAVTGLATGSEAVTYSAGGCITITTVTVLPLPSGISGASTICAQSTTTYSDLTVGVWSTANTSVATIDPSTGLLYALSAGTAVITYTTGAGCITTAVLTVNPLPLPIIGATDVCAGGATITVSDATPGGTWTSNLVTISATGVITGATSGTASVTYTLRTGCSTTALILVDPLPSGITGNLFVCPGTTSVLSDSTTGGVWSCGNTAMATVDPLNGTVTGITAGTVIISYTVGTGCAVTALVTIHPLPHPISGNLAICIMTTTTLSDGSVGGIWSSGAPGIALAGSNSGIVTGVAAGTANITYTLPTGCFTTTVVTVNLLPIGVTGINRVCIGGTTTLSDFPIGGTWSSANTSIAVVGLTSGIVSGVSVSVTTLTYTIGTGCIRTVPFTVNPLPPAITGPAFVCSGATITLSDVSTGGTWSSGNLADATVGLTTGVVTGGSVSTATITYTLATGCTTGTSVTVLPLPAVYNVTGSGSFCSLDTGIHVGLSGSAAGFTYSLYRGSSLIRSLPGTGTSLDFGLQTIGGTYIVIATNNITGCSVSMAGSNLITVIPAVTPAVSIVLGTSGIICTGTVTEFVAVPSGGGTSPTFQWQVNGINTSTINPYHYVPSNGDVITCHMTSNAACATTLTASTSYTVTVMANQTPLVSITASPGDAVCAGTLVTYIPSPVFGGAAPAYTWKRNSIIAGTGSSYSYTPLNGDTISCIMVSDYSCLVTNVANSNDIVMSVSPVIVPAAVITATPGITILQGQNDTLTVTATSAGTSPLYQWYINGSPVPGATTATFISSSFTNNDSVSCIVTGSGACEGSASAFVIITISNLGVTQVASAGSDIRLVPNPNKGSFIIEGSLTDPACSNCEISLEITDMLGQVIYRNTVVARNGKINEQVVLANVLANGMYLLNLRSANENRVFHFVIEQ